MLASKARAQLPVVRQRSDVHLRNRADCVCHLPSRKVSQPRQALPVLAALMLSVQSYTAQASPFSPGRQASVPAQEATGIAAMDTIPGRSPLVLMGLGWVAIASVVSYKETRGDT